MCIRDSSLVDLVYRMLVKNPAARIPSVRLVGAELEVVLYALKHGPEETPTRTPSSLRARSSTRFETPTPAGELIRNNLGGQTTPFVGRAAELGDLYRLLQESSTRLIIVQGPGGMGKTRLILELGMTVVEGRIPGTQARRREPAFSDGVYMVSLQALTHADAIPNAIAEALGFQIYPGTPAHTQLLDYLRDKAVLLLVDNCEQVVEGLSILTDILHAAPDAKIISTSRAKLGLQGETLFSIEGLDFPSTTSVDDALRYGGVQLFIQSARRIQPRFELRPEDVPAVARICALVGGMPLGIELAAGWAELLSPQEIADEVSRSLDFLESNTGVGPSRQRSVRAVFESSWALLTSDERAVFTCIAAFRGSFTRAAGQAVTGAGLRPLMGLVNKSFLQRDPDSGRYVAHELMRQFAEERLRDSGDAERVYAAHSAFYLKTVGDSLPAIQGRGQPEAFTAIDWDFENIRSAFMRAAQHGDIQLLLHAAHPLGIYFDLRAMYPEGLALFSAAADVLRSVTASSDRDDALAILLCWAGFYASYFRQKSVAEPLLGESLALVRPDSPPEVRAQTSTASGYFNLLLGDIPTAREHFRQASSLFMKLGRFWDAAHIQMNCGSSFWYRCDAAQLDYDKARRLTLDALKLAQQIGEGHLEAYCYLSLGRIDGLQQEYEAAAQNMHKAIPLFREARNFFAYGNALLALSVNGIVRGRLDDARPLIRENVAIQRDRGSGFGVAQSLLVECRLELCAGNWDAAAVLGEQALEMAERIGNPEFTHTARVTLARANIAVMDFDAAHSLLQRAFKAASELDRHADMSVALNFMCLVRLGFGEIDAARSDAQNALSLADSVGSHSYAAVARIGLGRIAAATGQTEQAREYFQAALGVLRDNTAQHSIDGWDDGYRNDALLALLADMTDLELMAGNVNEAREYLRELLFEAGVNNSVPAQLNALGISCELIIQLGDPQFAAQIAVFLREQPRAYASDRARASSLLRRLHQSMESHNFESIVNRPSALQLDDIIRTVFKRL